MDLDRDFREFVGSFIGHEVRFLLIGGYALAAHGLPRATGDLDTWVWLDRDNASKIIAALDEFGFGSLGLSVDDFVEPEIVVQLGYPPHRIDIITSIDGVDFDDAWERRMMVNVGGVEVPIIGREELILNKIAAGRPQDLADVARLRAGPEHLA
ncbi:nucleotidyl transferase AbiEii/AbiGii toxin family protein [soil metagenome]|nr:nucleotidyltransferase [Acidimicrobiia bacterium]